MIFNKLTTNTKGSIKVKLILPAASVAMGPPVSTILGQYRVDMSQFCKSFNDSTKEFEKGALLPVKILLKVGGAVNYTAVSPSVTYLTKRLLIDLLKNKQKKISNLMIYKILIIKMRDSKLSEFAVLRSILGTLKSMQLNKYHSSGV